jgi:hypothetical protein
VAVFVLVTVVFFAVVVLTPGFIAFDVFNLATPVLAVEPVDALVVVVECVVADVPSFLTVGTALADHAKHVHNKQTNEIFNILPDIFISLVLFIYYIISQ